MHLPVHADELAPLAPTKRAGLRRRRHLAVLAVLALVALFAWRYVLAPGALAPHWSPIGHAADAGAAVVPDDADAPVRTTTRGPAEPAPKPLPASAQEREKALWLDRSEQVKAAFMHAYGAYTRFAFGHDELTPLSQSYVENYNGWGVSIIDSLDTMMLMDLPHLVEAAIPHVANLTVSSGDSYIPFFETTIRYLGGFLSAYALTNNPLFLSRADDIGRTLLPVFNTSYGLPAFSVHPRLKMNGFGWMGDGLLLAEIGSCQLEFRYLAKLTGRAEYARAVDDVTSFLADLPSASGLLPLSFSALDGSVRDAKAAVGASADSAYEYFLKGWLQTNRTEDRLRDLYIRSADAILEHLLYLSPTRGLLYATDAYPFVPSQDGGAPPAGQGQGWSQQGQGQVPAPAQGPKDVPQGAALAGDNAGVVGPYRRAGGPMDPLLPQPDAPPPPPPPQQPAPVQPSWMWTAGGLSANATAFMPSGQFEHLTCFLPGLLALGYATLPADKRDPRHLWAAQGLAETCFALYADSATGLGPDSVHFDTLHQERWVDALGAWEQEGKRGSPPGTRTARVVPMSQAGQRDYMPLSAGYMLRPETIESLYLLWRVTGDAKWRARGWALFSALNKHTRLPSGAGFANIRDVEARSWTGEPDGVVQHEDSTPSWFFAETLKYAYLLTRDDELVPLERWVFNTEAHPLPVFGWERWEAAAFDIPGERSEGVLGGLWGWKEKEKDGAP